MLVKFCPALPRICYQPRRTRLERTVEDITKMLEVDRVVVLSGSSHTNFTANRHIGKTTVTRERLKPHLEKAGMSVTSLDVVELYGIVLELGLFNVEAAKRRVSFIQESDDVYIIDEIHQAFPVSKYPEEIEVNLMFWQKIDKIIGRGGKLILVSAVHPLDPTYKNISLNPTMARFFTAPVVELPARF